MMRGQVTTRIPTGNTPMRTRHQSSAIPPNILTQKPHRESSLDIRTLSPNKLNATKKPMISPKGYDKQYGSKTRKGTCVNHYERQAEFRMIIQCEAIFYCERCAAQLASQGFKVERLQPSKTKDRRVFNSKFEGHPRAQEVYDFLEKLRHVQRHLKQNCNRLMNIQNHYAEQIRYTDQFFNEVVCYINELRNQQICLLREEGRKYAQLGLMECGTNEENLEEISEIAHDIESQMDSIVTTIPQEQFKQCLNQYNKNLEIYKHRIQQQNLTLRQLSDAHNGEMDSKFNIIKETLSGLFEEKEQQFGKNFSFDTSKEVRDVRAIFKKHDGKENRSPFRNLFEGSLDKMPDESPSFKPF